MKRFVFLLICIAALRIVRNSILISDDVIYDSLSDQLSHERIIELLDRGKKWEWLSYCFLPFLLLIKLLFVAACLSIGALFLRTEAGFQKFLKIATTAEFVFLIPPFISLCWFAFVNTQYTLQDLKFFSPLSMINFFSHSELEPWLVYPIQLLNVFELLYWAVLAWQLQEVLKKSFPESLGFVMKTYGVGLIVWVVVVMFLTVSLT